MPRSGFDNEWLNKLRDANDLVALMSTYFPLKRIGRKYWANCPFHHEKSPSLCVNEDEQYYHCFGCGESGNVISFVMKMESLDFLEAVTFLAKRCGMQVPTINYNDDIRLKKQKRDRAYQMLAIAKDFYKKSLFTDEGKYAMDYLLQRGITSEEIERFDLGFSPNWTGVINECRKKGFNDEELKEFGLLTIGDNREYDFFGKRLIFPIHDKFGDCVGFSGRDMEGRSHAKYKNSPQSIIFDKSKLIYGLHLAKKLKSDELKSLILCEGQMDVIAMHKAGFYNSVACLGTALTEFHAREISRLVDKAYLCFDGDDAGQNAIAKAIGVLKEFDLALRVVQLPRGKDPDEVIKEKGREELQALIENAIDSTEFELRYMAKKYDLEDNMGRTKFLKEAISYLNSLKLQAQRDVYIPLVSKLSRVSTEIIRRDVNSNTVAIKQDKQITVDELKHKPDALLKAQRYILSSMLHKRDYVHLDEDFRLGSKNIFYNELYKKLYSYLKDKKEFAVATIIDETEEVNMKQLNEIISVDLDNIGDQQKYFNECVKQIKIFYLTQREDELKAMINQEPDLILRSKLLKNLQEISKQKYKIRTEG